MQVEDTMNLHEPPIRIFFCLSQLGMHAAIGIPIMRSCGCRKISYVIQQQPNEVRVDYLAKVLLVDESQE